MIELRRLTGCSVDRLLSELESAGYLRSLPKKTQAGAWAPTRRVVETGWVAGLAMKSMSTIIVHVVPITGGGPEEAELALVWEPVSRALFFDTARSFEGHRLLSFVAGSLKRLPGKLGDRIVAVQFTHPYQEGRFWYEEDRELIDRSYWPRRGDIPTFVRQPVTHEYGPIHFTPILKAGGWRSIHECAGTLIDRYNLGRAPVPATAGYMFNPELRDVELEKAGPLARLHELLDRKKTPSAIEKKLATRPKQLAG